MINSLRNACKFLFGPHRSLALQELADGPSQ
jgi:hypothetical protein